MEKEIDTWNDEDKLICPYCGHVEKVDEETFNDSSAECDTEMECEECGKTFGASRTCQFYYETFK